MKKLVLFVLIVSAVLFPACSDEGGANGESPGKKVPFRNHSNAIIIHWNSLALETMQVPAYDPMIGSRIFAMVHIAMHDALNSIAPVYETYTNHGIDKKADPIAAVSAAAYTVLVKSFPDRKDFLDAALAESTKNVKSTDAKQRGITLGTAAGNAIYALRESDGAFANPISEVNNPLEPGVYQAVPPMAILYAPFWATLPTFGLESPQQFRSVSQPGITSEIYTRDYNEVKEKGRLENSTRTDEETFIAKFWYEFSDIGWNRVTAVAAMDKKLDLISTARLFALVNMAMADSYIAGWDAKFHYNFWRPYTAIRAAETDGNGNTAADTNWEPLMVTPPVQDYPSTHSTLGNAAAVVLSNIIGANTAFTMTSTSAEPANSTRTFSSFAQAAVENADSRVLAGLHFRFSCEEGLVLGEKVGQWMLNHQLKPLKGNF